MTTMLSQAKKPAATPLIATICGQAGSGKSTIPWPKPFLIRVEGENLPRDIQTDRMPDTLDVVRSSEDIKAQLRALLTEEHDYKTLIIDSVTSLDAVFEAEILAADSRASSINQAMGGYGAGYSALAARHSGIRKTAEMLREKKGMNVIFIAHAETGNVQPPDGDDYTQYTIRLHKKSEPYYIDQVDLVGFLKMETLVKGGDGERKRAITTGARLLTCYMTPACVSKNRFGITEDLEVPKGQNPLKGIVPMAGASAGKKTEVKET